jgi:hypothetical protein
MGGHVEMLEKAAHVIGRHCEDIHFTSATHPVKLNVKKKHNAEVCFSKIAMQKYACPFAIGQGNKTNEQNTTRSWLVGFTRVTGIEAKDAS